MVVGDSGPKICAGIVTVLPNDIASQQLKLLDGKV